MLFEEVAAMVIERDSGAKKYAGDPCGPHEPAPELCWLHRPLQLNEAIAQLLSSHEAVPFLPHTPPVRLVKVRSCRYCIMPLATARL